nr:type II toxin-antitoxin system VapC family toxin [uncultured Halomonas sp.]
MDGLGKGKRQLLAFPSIRFLEHLAEQELNVYLSVITVGELQRGIGLIRHRGDLKQAELLASWLQNVLDQYAGNILEFGLEEARVWGRLRLPQPENALDKQIAATALIYDLTLVTRNIRDFSATGVKLLDPFE